MISGMVERKELIIPRLLEPGHLSDFGAANRLGQLGGVASVIEVPDILRFGDVLRFPGKNKNSAFVSVKVLNTQSVIDTP